MHPDTDHNEKEQTIQTQDGTHLHAADVLEHVGDLLENTIGSGIEHSRLEAPLLDLEEETPDAETGDVPASVKLMKLRTWYRVPISGGISGDGSGYHIYIKQGSTRNLVVFFSGGGVAWNAYTAARPVTGGRMAAKIPNFYWSNLRPATQIMNINTGITDVLSSLNPFLEWNFAVITYATGDFHIGDSEFAYQSEEGEDRILHFHGYRNFRAAMDICAKVFPAPERLLIAGDSAGAFAVPALAGDILEDYYPDCTEITLFSDSGTLPYDGWADVAKNVWHAPEKFYRVLDGPDIVLSWYRAFAGKWMERQENGTQRHIRCLYASSTRDHLLSTYYNDLVNHVYETNVRVQEIYYQLLCGQMRKMKEIFSPLTGLGGRPVFGMFIHEHKDLLRSMTGTVHTMVRHPAFLLPDIGRKSMAEWLRDAESGDVYDTGAGLLKY